MNPGARTSTESALLIADYFRVNGRIPSLDPSRPSEERRLALALARLRLRKRRGTLPVPVCNILDEAIPGWLDGWGINGDRMWQARMDELVAWVEKHGRLPHWSTGDPAERALAAWVTRYRTHARTGRHPERIKEMDARLPSWHLSPSSVPKRRPGRKK